MVVFFCFFLAVYCSFFWFWFWQSFLFPVFIVSSFFLFEDVFFIFFSYFFGLGAFLLVVLVKCSGVVVLVNCVVFFLGRGKVFEARRSSFGLS